MMSFGVAWRGRVSFLGKTWGIGFCVCLCMHCARVCLCVRVCTMRSAPSDRCVARKQTNWYRHSFIFYLFLFVFLRFYVFSFYFWSFGVIVECGIEAVLMVVYLVPCYTPVHYANPSFLFLLL